MKPSIRTLLALAALTTIPCPAQEIVTSPKTGKEYLFVGSLSEDGEKGKFVDNRIFRWITLEGLQQSGFLTTEPFLEEVFSRGLHFEMEGYEPFWKARLTKNSLIFFDPVTGDETTYPIRIITNSGSLNSMHIYFMFEGRQGHVFGSVEYAGLRLRYPDRRECCEYLIFENETLLYSVLITVGDETYEGCAGVYGFNESRDRDEVTGLNDYEIYSTWETIVQDLNGDGAAEKTAIDEYGHIIITDGATGAEIIFDDGGGNRDFSGEVSFWGITTDTETWRATFSEGPDGYVWPDGSETVLLLYPSVFVRRNESGGGVITFDGEKYVWVHQND